MIKQPSSFKHDFHARLPKQPQKISADRSNLLSIAKQLNLAGSFVEIGTYRGEFASILMNVCNPAKLYCVDPYKSYDDFKDAINVLPMEFLLEDAKKRLAPYGDQIEFLRMTSIEAAPRFLDGLLDLVYIDSNHRYNFVMQDLEAWYPKVKTRGMLCGDDMIDGENDRRNGDGDVVHPWGHYGVYKAVSDFCQRQNIKFHCLGTQFAIFKGEITPS